MAHRLYRHTHTAPPFATQGCVQLADMAFRKTQFDLAFALARAGEPSACRDSLVIVSPTPAWCDVQECTSTARAMTRSANATCSTSKRL